MYVLRLLGQEGTRKHEGSEDLKTPPCLAGSQGSAGRAEASTAEGGHRYLPQRTRCPTYEIPASEIDSRRGFS